MKKIKVKELITELENFNPDVEILLSSDEELNCLFSDIGVSVLKDNTTKESKWKAVMWEYSGSEVDVVIKDA